MKGLALALGLASIPATASDYYRSDGRYEAGVTPPAKASALGSVKLRHEVLKDFPAPQLGLSADAVRMLERLQAAGLPRSGQASAYAGLYSEEVWPEALGVPGPGSPVLGAGTWAMLGAAGEAARKRGSLLAAPSEPKERRANGKKGENPGEDAANPGAGDECQDALKRADARLRRFTPRGAIVRADLDPEHWLAFGAGEEVAVMARSEGSLIARDPVETAGRFAAPEWLYLGGLLWPEAAGRISRTAYLTREGVGRGQVILFSDDPNFRGYSRGTARLFLNAVLLGPGLGTERTVPW